jgi:hypothetical protein
MIRSVALLSAVALAVPLGLGAVQNTAPAGTQVERAFQKGGRIRLDLAAGEYKIQGSDLDVIRVRWRTRKPEDAWRAAANVVIERQTARISTHGPKDGFHVQIDVPRRTDLDLNLSAGELDIRGIEGSKNLSMWAGEATVEVGEASLYRRVDASVRVGELNARPFDVSKGGILRSFTRSGQGKYTFQARLFAGELTLMR